MDILELTQKIVEVCTESDITIEWIKSGENRANGCQKKVWIKEIADSGDFAVALHEIGHAICDPDNASADHLQRLDAETNAWQWALACNNNNFDAEGWNRLHRSLHQYYSIVMDTSHASRKLLVRAEEQDDRIQPRVSSYQSGPLNLGRKKRREPKGER
jgi:hypothetical protein